MNTANSLNSEVFQDELNFDMLKQILATLDHITPKKVSREEYIALQGNFLVETGEHSFGKSYDLFLPEDLVHGELLHLIDFLSSKFGIENYTPYSRIITQTKVMIGIILRGVGADEGERYLQDLSQKYNISEEFISRLQAETAGGDKLNFSEAKNFIKKIKSKRNENSREKLGQNHQDTHSGFEELKNLYGREFELTFFRKAIHMLRYSMTTMTHNEQKFLRDKGVEEGEKVRFNVSDEELDQEERLLRDKIGIDNFKKELINARNSKDEEKINELEFQASNAILKAIYEYPYQLTQSNYGDKPIKILESKEIFCVGCSLLGHAFLSELEINHSALDIPGHSALKIDIGGLNYLFDPTWINSLREITGENRLLFQIKSTNKNIDSKLLGTIYWNNCNKDITLAEKLIMLNLPEGFNYKGFFLSELGKYKEALKYYNEAINLEPTNSGFHKNLGVLFMELRQYNEAIKYFLKAIELNPLVSISYLFLGNCFEQLGKYNEAISYYNSSIWLDPEEPRYYTFTKNIYKKIGKIRLSCLYEYIGHKIRKNYDYYIPDLDRYKKQEIDSFIDKGDFEGLLQYLEIQQKISDIDILNMETIDQNKISHLEKLITDLSRSFPGNPEYYMIHGQLQALNGQIDSPIRFFNKAIEINPQEIDGYIIKSKLYKKLADNYYDNHNDGVDEYIEVLLCYKKIFSFGGNTSHLTEIIENKKEILNKLYQNASSEVRLYLDQEDYEGLRLYLKKILEDEIADMQDY